MAFKETPGRGEEGGWRGKRQTSREISPLTIKPLIFLSWDDCHRPHCGAQPLLSDTATIPEKVTVEECSRVGVPGGGDGGHGGWLCLGWGVTQGLRSLSRHFPIRCGCPAFTAPPRTFSELELSARGTACSRGGNDWQKPQGGGGGGSPDPRLYAHPPLGAPCVSQPPSPLNASRKMRALLF